MSAELENKLTQKFLQITSAVKRTRMLTVECDKQAVLQKARIDLSDLMCDLCAFDILPEVIGTSIDELRWLKDVIEGRVTNSMRPDDWDFLEEEDT